MLSVSEDLLTLIRWSCPLARFLALALKTSASRSCCSLYLMSRCPLEQRAVQFLTDLHSWKHQDKETSTYKSSISTTTKRSLKRINILSLMTNTNKQRLIFRFGGISRVLHTNDWLVNFFYFLFVTLLVKNQLVFFLWFTVYYIIWTCQEHTVKVKPWYH